MRSTTSILLHLFLSGSFVLALPHPAPVTDHSAIAVKRSFHPPEIWNADWEPPKVEERAATPGEDIIWAGDWVYPPPKPPKVGKREALPGDDAIVWYSAWYLRPPPKPVQEREAAEAGQIKA